MGRTLAILRSLFLVGACAGIATAIACTGGGGGDENILGGGSSGIATSSSSGVTSSSGQGSSGITSSSGIGSSTSSSGGPKGPTDVKDTYNHSCTVDDDCILVTLNGSVCGFCGGSNASINKSDQASYQTAYNTARANCPTNTATGSCAAQTIVSKCNASKQCEVVNCSPHYPDGQHNCQDAGP